MNFTNENKLEKLERKVEELERQLKDKTSKDEATREVQARLGGYQDHVRSDRGEIRLKKNFGIKNRRGAIPGQDSDVIDNVITLAFDEQKQGRLNHIFLGTESVQGNINCSVLQGVVVRKNDAPNIPNNGIVQFVLVNEDDLTSDGIVDTSKQLPQFQLLSKKLDGEELNGEAITMIGTGEDGDANLYYIKDMNAAMTGNWKRLWLNKNGLNIQGLPTSDPEIANVVWNDEGTLKISSG